jgi:hypothetical protein
MPSPFTNAAEAVHQAFANFHPEKPEDFDGFFKGLPDFLTEVTRSIGTLTDRADSEMPLKKNIVEDLREIVATLNGVEDKAVELQTHFRIAHEGELSRAENPRPGEKAWNIP